MATYPTNIKTYTPVVDNVNDVVANDVNSAYVEITAIETELGTDVAGTVTDLKTRLAQSISGSGNLDFAAVSVLTIASGAVTVTQNWHSLETESSAATDDLDTITATNCTDGFVLFVRQNNALRDVTIKHATGNIRCPGSADIIMTDTTSLVIMIYDGENAVWIAAPANVSVGALAGINIWTGSNIFSASFATAYTAVSSNTTLTTAHQTVDVDASSATVTITLPTAVSISGRRYDIRKLDSSANNVSIATTSSQTINGAATKTLSSQYDTCTLMSNGVNWIVL